MKVGEKMKPLWSREACAECGAEGLASRMNDVPASKVYVCDDCEAYATAHQEGLDAGRAEMAREVLAIVEDAQGGLLRSFDRTRAAGYGSTGITTSAMAEAFRDHLDAIAKLPAGE